LPKRGLSMARAPRGAMTKIQSNVHIIAAIGYSFARCFCTYEPMSRRLPTPGAALEATDSQLSWLACAHKPRSRQFTAFAHCARHAEFGYDPHYPQAGTSMEV
jgi:hypothetical protein